MQSQLHPLQSVTLGEHFATQSLRFPVCEMGTKMPTSQWSGGLDEQAVYKKHWEATITTSILALPQQLEEEAPYGVGSEDGGTEQSLTAGRICPP